jgi:hypothetical protein
MHWVRGEGFVADADADEAVGELLEAALDVAALGPERDEHGPVDSVCLHRLEQELDRRSPLDRRQYVDTALGVRPLREEHVHVTVDAHRTLSRGGRRSRQRRR